MTDPAQDYADQYNVSITKIKKETGATVKQLLAMSQGTDPFWMTRGKVTKALWAQDVVDTIVVPHLTRIDVKNIHLRDIHYILVSIPHHTFDNKTYENTMKCWKDLISAFSVARYLDFIDYTLIRDNKNEFERRAYYAKGRNFNGAKNIAMGNIDEDTVIEKIILKPFERLLNPWSTQKFHIELWAEKDLALMEKVAEDWNIDTVVGEGETSVTMVYDLVDRIIDADKPARIAYVADCDVVGMNMSKAMARKVEYRLLRRGSELDVKLIPLMLTAPQVREYDLPTVPMKTVVTKSGKAHGYETRKEEWFEAQNLDGAVEVNALHAQQPDVFEELLVDFIHNYLDVDKWHEFVNYRKGARQMVRDRLDEELLDLSSLTDMMEEVNWRSVGDEFRQGIKDIGISDISIEEADSKYSWMLDTTLTYGAQLGRYNAYVEGRL